METPEPEVPRAVDEKTLVDPEDRLDKLWEIHLGLLDQYVKAQQEIQKHLSSGFFSLARAQSSATSGRRYGQDWYDERMKATQRTQVSDGQTDLDSDAIATGVQSLKIFITSEDPQESTKEEISKDSTAEAGKEAPRQQPSPPGTPEPEHSSEQANNEEPEDDKKPRISDPLRWYGILVPPELKRTQASFTSLLQSRDTLEDKDEDTSDQGPIANAINAARGLREIEADIRKTRKAVKKADKAMAIS